MKKQSKRSAPVRVGIIGTGGMAKHHALSLKKVTGCRLMAAMDIDEKRARSFAREHGLPEVFTSVDEMLAADVVDAVTIVTPDSSHAMLAIQCLKGGKHVLCEKPLAVNYPDARRMVAAAKKAGVVNMVNFTKRNKPSIEAVAKLVRSGRLGEIRHVEANYLQSWLASKIWGDWRTDPKWLWRLSGAHGSKGVLGDVGVHILDFATYPVGPLKSVYCTLKAFDKAPGNRIGEYVLDANDSAVMTVEFANGALGTIHTSRWVGGHADRQYLKVAGTKGTAEIDTEWGDEVYRTCMGRDLHKAVWTEHKAKPVPNLYERFIKSIRTGKPEQPDFARGAEVQKILDGCYESNAQKQAVKFRVPRSK